MTPFPRVIRITYPALQHLSEVILNEWFYTAVERGRIAAHVAKDAHTLEARALLLHEIGVIRLHARWREALRIP